MTNWRMVRTPAHLGPNLIAWQAEVGDGHLSVFVGEEPPGWHLSISHRSNLLDARGRNIPGRYPTWDEIVEARYRFVPDRVHMAMLLPPKAEYVNIHQTTFHLWQIPAEVGA